MRTLFRDLAVRVSLWTLALTLLAANAAVWLLVQLGATAAGEERLPAWVVLLAGLVTGLVVAASALGLSRGLADRAAESVADPLRRLAQRTDEMTSGGFALDPEARPGRLVELEPWQAGITEIDAVAREIDRHHHTLARTLVSERSFAADASHQLRTPLAALLLRLEEISSLAADDPEVRTEAEVAIAQVERLTGVVDELLRRTRVGHASGGALSSVDAVLNGLDEEWTPAFAERGRRIEVTCERGIIVEVSASALSQVLNALVENSLTHGGGRVSLDVARSGPSAVFTLTDQGPGVPAHLAASVFDRAVTSGTGTGLGLAVARDTAEAAGGRIELTQLRPPVFALYLPLALTP